GSAPGRDCAILRANATHRPRRFRLARQSHASQLEHHSQHGWSRLRFHPYLVQNITYATNAGMYAGPYHFGRMDITEDSPVPDGIANDGADEADHFIEMAGAWMRPGYLLPVFDFEAGLGIRTSSELAQFAIDFSDRIYEVKGIRPAVYIGTNYAQPMNAIPESAE